MKLSLNKVLFYLRRYLLLFMCLFTIYIGCYSIVNALIFKNFYFPLNYIGFIYLISMVISLILVIILSLNKLNFIIQAVLIYITVTISIYFVGFYTNIFTRDGSFWLFSLIINLSGLCILLGYVMIKRTIENKKLNEKLKNYQGGNK